MPALPRSQLLSFLDLDKAILEVQSGWSSGPKNYRRGLRLALLDTLTDQAKFPGLEIPPMNAAALSDLSAPPQLLGYSISISHCPIAGGFLVSPIKGGQVGLDLEERSKVTREIVLRMSDEMEVLLAPEPAVLWSAKEATFKSLLGPSQPTALSQVKIGGWFNLGLHIWGFQAQIQGVNSNPILGVSHAHDNLVVGIAKFTA
jgi:hypothetical protein